MYATALFLFAAYRFETRKQIPKNRSNRAAMRARLSAVDRREVQITEALEARDQLTKQRLHVGILEAIEQATEAAAAKLVPHVRWTSGSYVLPSDPPLPAEASEALRKAAAARSETQAARAEELAITKRLQDRVAGPTALEETLDDLENGKIAINPPKTMRVGRRDIVEVCISGDIKGDLVLGMRGAGAAEQRSLPVGRRMSVHLAGPAFDIKDRREHQEKQPVPHGGFATWSYWVTPSEWGEQELDINVGIRPKPDAPDEDTEWYPIIDKPVHVEMNLPLSLYRFLASNWQWILTAFVLPVGPLLWKRFSGRFRGDKESLIIRP